MRNIIKLPKAHTGDTVYLSDGRSGIFLEKCELADRDYPCVCDIIQLDCSDDYIIYNFLDPDDIMHIQRCNHDLIIDHVAELIIKLSVAEVRS